MDDDRALLQSYVATGSPDAFAALVRRHVDLVHSAALRRTRDPHLADDVTQATFLLLSQKARALKPGVLLTGWLYNTARFTAATAMRAQHRRQRHERDAAALTRDQAASGEGAPSWEEIAPHLDAAMDRLSDADRRVVLLRFFERRSHDEVARRLEISEAAATKRLSRAVEKLRKYLAARGAGLPAPALAAGLLERAIAPAPARVADAAASLATTPAAPAAGAIAKGVNTMKLIAQAKLAAAVLVALTIVAGSAIAAARGGGRWLPQVGRGSAAAPAGTYMIVATYEVLAGPDLAADIRRMSQPIDSGSVGYEARLVDSEPLLNAIAAAQKARAAVLGISDNARFFDQRQMQGWKDGFSFSWNASSTIVLRDGQRWVPYFNHIFGTLKLDARRDRVRLTIDSSRVDTKLRTSKIDPAAVKFDGDVPAGKSLLFVGRLGPEEGFEPTVVMIWQAVPTTPELLPYVTRNGDIGRWLARGAAGIARDAEDAVAWAKSAQSPDAPQPRWTRTLEGGTTVKLVAVAQGAPPYAWWDASGVAVTFGPGLMHGDGETAAVIDVAEPFNRGRKTGMEGTSNSSGRGSVVYRDNGEVQRVTVTPQNLSPLRLQVADGPWKAIGTIRPGKPLTAGGATYAIKEVSPIFRKSDGAEPLTRVQVEHHLLPGVSVSFAAVDRAGRQVPIDHAPDVRTKPVEPSPDPEANSLRVTIDPDDLDHLVVRTRPMRWVEFAGVATKPERVETGLARSIAAAAGATSQAVPGTPEAAIAALADAIERGDRAAARRYYHATDPPDPAATALADAMLDQLMAGVQLQQAMTKHFGAAEVARLRAARVVLLPDLDASRRMRWQVTGDTASPISTANEVFVGPSLRRAAGAAGTAGGDWKYDTTLPPGTDPAEVRAAIDRMKQQAELENALAADIRAGKLKDVDAVKDAIKTRRAAATTRSAR